jgi:hypothetical protein
MCRRMSYYFEAWRVRNKFHLMNIHLLIQSISDGESNFVLGGDRRFFNRRERISRGNYGSLQDSSQTSSTVNLLGSSTFSIKDMRGSLQGHTGPSNTAPLLGNENGETLIVEPREDIDLHFLDPEEDLDLEEDFRLARELTFGDSNFPVVQEDPRFAHPPEVQRNLDFHSQQWQAHIQSVSQ